jgi:ATP/maltotriose-dependent transcriptional regulator MalT
VVQKAADPDSLSASYPLLTGGTFAAAMTLAQVGESGSPEMRGRRIIQRPRLIKLLNETAARTILLVAPAGYGKTTLSRQWAEQRPGVHWYSAGGGSADVAQLTVGLAASIERSAPGVGEYAAQLVRALPNPAESASAIVDRVATFVGDLSGATIVLDDYQEIANNPAAAIFPRALQERLGFRLLVISRIRPKWATARLQIYGELLEVGAHELALTYDEAIEVLGPRARHDSELLKTAQGWPAVVALAAQADASILGSSDATAATLFRFFAEELFSATPTDLQESLITLALLPNLSKALVEEALERDPEPITRHAITSGLVNPGCESAELHPLVREYLLTKLHERDDASERVRTTITLSLAHGHWDHAFELVDRFGVTELLDPMIEASFKPLVSSGRIATLEQIAGHAMSTHHITPLVELIDAELAFRSGLFKRAEAVAARSARQLGADHPFTSHAWWIAGHAAQLSFDDARASQNFEKARQTAHGPDDLRDSLWGLVTTFTQAEAPAALGAVEQLMRQRNESPIDLVRATTAVVFTQRTMRLRPDTEVEEAMHALRAVEDPRVRTSFLNTWSYHLILIGQYDTAFEIAEQLRSEVDAYHLEWVRPHAEWALAAASLGQRQFAAADGWLRRVEGAAEHFRYGQLVLNACCLRARLLLALQRPDEALSALRVDETRAANKAMRGEFLGTNALVLAVLGLLDESSAAADEADRCTKFVEARAYAACARAVIHERTSGLGDNTRVLDVVKDLGTWDVFISAVRACPSLLKSLSDPSLYPSHVAALRNSHDFDLARQSGIDLGRRPRRVVGIQALSPREIEIFELVRQGLTNNDIARVLFISEATVKVHVRHILEKTGTRSRAEAVATLQRTS